MVWTSKDGPKCPSSPAYERIVNAEPGDLVNFNGRMVTWAEVETAVRAHRGIAAPSSNVSTTAQCGAEEVLLGCPFCGSPAKLTRFADLRVPFTQIECTNDDYCAVTADIQQIDEAAAIKAWNTRTTPAAPVRAAQEDVTRASVQKLLDRAKAGSIDAESDLIELFVGLSDVVRATNPPGDVREKVIEECAAIAKDHTPAKHEGTLAAHIVGLTIEKAIRAIASKDAAATAVGAQDGETAALTRPQRGSPDEN